METANQAPLPRAEEMFGRGLREIAWQVPLIGWVGGIVSTFVVVSLSNWLHPETTSDLLSGEHRVSFLVSVVISWGVSWWCISWLLGNIRRGQWLFACLVGVELLTRRLDYSLRAVIDLMHGKALYEAIRPALGLNWSYLSDGVFFGAGIAAAVTIALKLRPQRLVLVPLVSAAAFPIAFGITELVSGSIGNLAVNKEQLLGRTLQGLFFGLALWAGFECQRRRTLSAVRVDDRRFDTGMFVIWPAVGLLLGLDLLVAASNEHNGTWQGPVLITVAVLAILASAVMNMVFLYRAWAAIRSPFTTSPGSAVGLLFVPLFNFYWIFQAFPGMASAYNAYVDHHEFRVPHLSRGWFLSFVLSSFVVEIPLAGLFFTWLPVVAGAVMISRLGDAVNRLPEAPA